MTTTTNACVRAWRRKLLARRSPGDWSRIRQRAAELSQIHDRGWIASLRSLGATERILAAAIALAAVGAAVPMTGIWAPLGEAGVLAWPAFISLTAIVVIALLALPWRDRRHRYSKTDRRLVAGATMVCALLSCWAVALHMIALGSPAIAALVADGEGSVAASGLLGYAVRRSV